jgi:hypothetical protein
MPDPATDQPRQDSVTRVTEVLGVIAGIAALIYVTGGAIFLVRISLYGVTEPAVVSSLPREFLVPVGLLSLAVPWLLGGCLSLVVLSLSKDPRRTWTGLLLFAGVLLVGAVGWVIVRNMGIRSSVRCC